MGYLLFTDATADLTQELADKLDIRVLPMEFMLEGRTYHNYPDNRELAPKAFYDRLRAGGSSTTSQINAETLKDSFRPVLAAGQDILYLVFSSGLSGTFQSAQLAAEELRAEFPERRIEVFDTRNASMGEGLMAYHAALLRQKGKAIDEIMGYLGGHLLSFNSWFTVDDLMFLKRGGRLSGGAALAGTLLGIKPVLHVDDDGHLINMEKVRGRKASLDRLVKHYAEHGVDKKEHAVFVAHGDCLEDAQYVAEKIKAAGAGEVFLGTIGPVIGAHSGPGTLALFFFGDGR